MGGRELIVVIGHFLFVDNYLDGFARADNRYLASIYDYVMFKVPLSTSLGNRQTRP